MDVVRQCGGQVQRLSWGAVELRVFCNQNAQNKQHHGTKPQHNSKLDSLNLFTPPDSQRKRRIIWASQSTKKELKAKKVLSSKIQNSKGVVGGIGFGVLRLGLHRWTVFLIRKTVWSDPMMSQRNQMFLVTIVLCVYVSMTTMICPCKKQDKTTSEE